MNPLLILTAVELEARALARALDLPLVPTCSFLAFGRSSIRLAPVGLRAGFCASRWAELLEGLERPLIVSAGVCGGLDPRLGPGALVIPEWVLGPTGDLQGVLPSAHRLAVAQAGAAACTGLLVTTVDVAATPEAKASLRRTSGAVAADMESAVILAHAAAGGYPALVVRAVSDGAGEHLPPELVRLVTPAGGLRLARAVALAMRRPAVLPRALSLRHRTRQALRAVAFTLAALVA